MEPRIDFEVCFTDGTTERVTTRILSKPHPGEPPLYVANGAQMGQSPERAVSFWAWHRLMQHSIDGDHASGIASIRRVT